MGLTCKPGNYDEVLKKLLFKMFIDPQDMYTLYGPLDILIEFNGLRNLGEFVTKWFNPMRMIGAEDDLITKIQNLIVVKENQLPAEAPSAFVFMNAKPSNLENVRESLLTIPEVLSAGSVLGPYDVISSVKTKDNSELEEVVSTIEHIPGVQSSAAAPVATINTFSDW